MVEHVPRRFAERRSHERDGLFDVLFDKLRPQAQHPIAQTTELSIAPLIRTRTLRVIPAIHFDDEPSRRCEEIDNHPADDHLPPKLHAELTRAQRRPKTRFRASSDSAHLRCTLGEDLSRVGGDGSTGPAPQVVDAT